MGSICFSGATHEGVFDVAERLGKPSDPPKWTIFREELSILQLQKSYARTAVKRYSFKGFWPTQLQYLRRA